MQKALKILIPSKDRRAKSTCVFQFCPSYCLFRLKTNVCLDGFRRWPVAQTCLQHASKAVPPPVDVGKRNPGSDRP
ncbi:unnamed protein product [Protopolystoma xenopodis]|uniref:Uncharacterized protein n=1 Tax=Protopolystoma xenopodis TaxID=117903 RepID=A0A448WF20_9PLAT|nr:unnamed protein product [Protopolystoma xenopodis]